MKDNETIEHSQILDEIKNIKRELEDLKVRKSQLKMKLFYDSSNPELKNKLKIIKNYNQELNKRLSELNNQLLNYLNCKVY